MYLRLLTFMLSLSSAFPIVCDQLTQDIWSAPNDNQESSIIISCACRMCYNEQNYTLTHEIDDATKIGITWHQGQQIAASNQEKSLESLSPCPNHDDIDGPISKEDIMGIAYTFWEEIGEIENESKKATFCQLIS